jgi:chromosome segregation ATPase
VSIIDPGDYQLLNEQVKETHKTLEESERIINGLKDQSTELRFQLTQKQSEITSLQHLLKTKEESCHFETNELRSKCDSLRTEIVNLSKKIDRLSEEKNQYRAQVQDMNVALKNSLEHIKRLRTQSSSLEELGQEFEQNAQVLEDNQEAVKKPNLTNLTNCLSTLIRNGHFTKEISPKYIQFTSQV